MSYPLVRDLAAEGSPVRLTYGVLVLAGMAADDDEPVRHVVEHLHTALAPPLDVAGSTLHLSAGIGYALSPRDGTDAAALIDTADARMYQTKKAS